MPSDPTAALIVAAGRGTRAGGGLAKQWRMIAGRRVIDWTIDAFRAAPSVGPIALVLPRDDADARADFAGTDLILAAGGAERADSVAAGLAALNGTGATRVLIHDAARPCVSVDLIEAVAHALDHGPAAAPGLAVTDALWTGGDGKVTGTRDRAGLYAAQTPQGFHIDTIRAAHRARQAPAADDVEVARAAGMEVTIVPGQADNMKITTPEDFARAERILAARSEPDLLPIRVGNGFDVHRFAPGDHVILCGVAVPHDRTLSGHSDADVGMHAVTDAIYGALADGDIGQHFPPTDPQWKGADSAVFLRHAVALAAERGYRIGNVDCTLICERPKIGPHAMAMREAMATIMGMSPADVSVKATTTERLGFAGRGEGIAAQATAMLVRA
ncbi:bifunctional 2-C-methyl-D-erythritol 4-phosphate cytidylyltransferase/2-C-methyl-D-erythritol 2,4-cyclodiphosphate synthase [Chachezhania sediminis]|uniref:bifunctional 2-C-methyl-D-erythritol 4-phosphate cytidylyltransferase/2-C-methyl-D-erythritol 2,4-cyclodiphosphate synthase n=1 Tax=Chachezhania sediminis TaxID=2599291 RepID=UPI00131D419C|nr:bifunctional 2-C-methyl-D-erythritol 4-phosphate cytidylyltransferase/2-C-methyl-D-erythritol 2,4-cyclodiphosphate synthase [Chachezhania sediminis]